MADRVVTYSTMIILLITCGTGFGQAQGKPYVLDRDGKVPGSVVAIKDVAAWPNLTQLPNGTILAFIYNQPSHGRMPGDVECWATEDEGVTWTKRSVAAPRGTPEQNRMNVAAGLTADGKVILVTSGWSHPGNPDAEGLPTLGRVLPTWVCISEDNGRTWKIDRDSFPEGPDGRALIPFGDIMPGADGKLRVAAYRGALREGDPKPNVGSELAQRAAEGQNWIVRGDGYTWDPPMPLSPKMANARNPFNETALLHLGDGKWLAAARYGSGSTFPHLSEDDGRTWKQRRKVRGHPAHLLRLDDGTIALTYGKRGAAPRGVEVVFSHNEGLSWSEPYRIVDIEGTDLGYPSSVQLSDGRVLTAFYANKTADYDNYHMATVTWDPATTLK